MRPPEEKKKNDLSKADLKALGKALLPLFILVLLGIFVFRNVFTRVSAQKQSLATAKRDVRVLTEKQELLAEISNEAAELVYPLTFALPHENASLMMLSQLKTLSAQSGLFLANMKSGPLIPDAKTGLSRHEIQFDADGDMVGILSFLENLPNAAPISRLETVSVSSAGAASRGEIKLSVFTAPLPKTLPAITEPVRELTDAELETLNQLATLFLPPLLEVEAQGASPRANPFE